MKTMINSNELTLLSVFGENVIVSTKEGYERTFAITNLNKIHIKVTKRPLSQMLFLLTPFPFLLVLPVDMDLFILTTVLSFIIISLIGYQRINNRIKFKLVIHEQNNLPVVIDLPIDLKYKTIETISVIKKSRLYRKEPKKCV